MNKDFDDRTVLETDNGKGNYKMFPLKKINKVASYTAAFFIVSVLSDFTPPAVLAQNPAGADDPVAVYKEAGINSEQESNIRKMAQDFDQKSAVQLKTLEELLQELKALAYKSTLDGNAMLAKQDQINKLQSEMAIQRIQLVIKIRNLLTPSQNEKLVSILQNRMREEAESAPK